MAKLNILVLKLIILSCIMLYSCNKNTTSYEISGKLSNLTGNYFLISYESSDSLIVDTVPISKQGEFSFKGEIDTLTEMSLYFNQNTKIVYLFVDKGWHVDLKGDILYPDLISVKGGDVNDDLTAFNNSNKELLKSRTDIVAMANRDKTDVKNYIVELKNINFELSNIAANYIKANPDKIASVILIRTFFQDESSLPRLDESLNLLKGKAADFPLVTSLRHFSNKVKISAEGSQAPNFIIKDIKDTNVNLSDYKGKYIALSFISTTCDICSIQKPEVMNIYKDFKLKKYNIEFITIVKDIEERAITDSISNDIKWPLLPVKNGWAADIFDTYYVHEIPYNILISPSGVILDRGFSINELPKKMEEYIKSEN